MISVLIKSKECRCVCVLLEMESNEIKSKIPIEKPNKIFDHAVKENFIGICTMCRLYAFMSKPLTVPIHDKRNETKMERKIKRPTKRCRSRNRNRQQKGKRNTKHKFKLIRTDKLINRGHSVWFDLSNHRLNLIYLTKRKNVVFRLLCFSEFVNVNVNVNGE